MDICLAYLFSAMNRGQEGKVRFLYIEGEKIRAIIVLTTEALPEACTTVHFWQASGLSCKLSAEIPPKGNSGES